MDPSANSQLAWVTEVPRFILILWSDTTVSDVWLPGISIPSLCHRKPQYVAAFIGRSWVERMRSLLAICHRSLFQSPEASKSIKIA